MRRKFYINISGICHNHNEAAAEGGGAPTPAPEPPPAPPPADPPAVEPPAPPAVPDGYVPATEVETERTARTAAETRANDLEARATAAEQRARANEIRLAAQTLGFQDPADAERFIAADAEDVTAALTEVLTSKPYLKRAEAAAVVPPVTPTQPTNPAREGAQLTAEGLKGMTAAQIAQLPWSEVSAALARK
ncbi:MAG: hypothetical protein LC795_15600 [Acidobacteria bacterium]|nr:hypothetical protein [Acidobacteriota bacterium]MCA1620700.1 hypothetical protein [Acidobacteriota bacterium]